MAVVKCKYCGKQIAKDNAYKIADRQYYCNKTCYDDKQRSKIDNGKTNKIKYKPQEGTERREFTDYIQMIYINSGWNKYSINWSMVCSQASNILNEHPKWTYDTLLYILQYMNEVLGLQLVTKESNYSPLSLVPFYATEAEEYFIQTQDIEDKINSFDFNTEVKIVKNINRQYKKNNYNKINIENIL